MSIVDCQLAIVNKRVDFVATRGYNGKMEKKIGIRELKNQTSKIVRQVREEAAEYVITLHGEPVAVLRPIQDEDQKDILEAEIEKEIAEMQELAELIAENWQSEKTGVQLVEEQRREL